MVRGRGRGRGRPQKELLTTFGSSVSMGKQVITPLPSAMQLKVQPGTSEGSNPKELDLSSPVGPSTDLVSGEQTPTPTHSVDLEIEVETDELGATWASLFKDNRSAQNGMNLTDCLCNWGKTWVRRRRPRRVIQAWKARDDSVVGNAKAPESTGGNHCFSGSSNSD